MKRPPALFARLALLFAALFCFGSVASAFDCGSATPLAAAMAMPCHDTGTTPKSDISGSCVLICGAVMPHASILPMPTAVQRVVHPFLSTEAAGRSAAPEPPPPRSA